MSLKDWWEKTFGPLEAVPSNDGWAHYRPASTAGGGSPVEIVNNLRSAPSREEFRAWRADPTTRFVMQALRNSAELQKAGWEAASWDSGNADPLALREFRTRADAYLSIEEGTYEDFCERAGVEPEKEEQAA